MASTKSRPRFFETEQGMEIELRLVELEASEAYQTNSSYTPDGIRYPGNVISFVDKHKTYIVANPGVDPTLYVDNLRLKTRLRR